MGDSYTYGEEVGEKNMANQEIDHYLHANQPVIVRVTLNATASFETRTRVTGTGLFITSNVNGQSNQVTTASYRLLLP